MHHNPQTDTEFWELAFTDPITAMQSDLFALCTLTEPERWLDMEVSRFMPWSLRCMPLLPLKAQDHIAADIIERSAHRWESVYPGNLCIRSLIDALRLRKPGYCDMGLPHAIRELVNDLYAQDNDDMRRGINVLVSLHQGRTGTQGPRTPSDDEIAESRSRDRRHRTCHLLLAAVAAIHADHGSLLTYMGTVTQSKKETRWRWRRIVRALIDNGKLAITGTGPTQEETK